MPEVLTTPKPITQTEHHRAINQVSEVNDALTLLLTLLDAAHDQRASLDRVRSLLAPLQQKLEGALQGLAGHH